jgi:hypothetical protein
MADALVRSLRSPALIGYIMPTGSTIGLSAAFFWSSLSAA